MGLYLDAHLELGCPGCPGELRSKRILRNKQTTLNVKKAAALAPPISLALESRAAPKSVTGNFCHPVGGSCCLFLKIRYIAGTDNCKRQSPHEAVSKVCNSLLSHLELLLVSHNSIPPAQWELVTLRTFRRGGRMQDLPDGICCQQRRAP